MPQSASTSQLEANLGLYRFYGIASRLFFWFPTSVLFFLERTSLGTTFQLLSVYFLTVVALEVPSGWASDRFGRVLMLRLASVSWLLAYTLLVAAGSSFVLLAIGQMLVALGFASASGTDSSFHFDTLEAAGREGEFEEREGRVASNGLIGTTAAALIGGALGLIDLRLPFAASALAAVVLVVITARMVEPIPEHDHDADGTPLLEPPPKLFDAVRYLGQPAIAWIFLFMLVQQPLESLALDNMQPWLTRATGATLDAAGRAPLYSGVLVAIISLIGAASARGASWFRQTLGLRRALTCLALIEVVILGAMALTFSPWIIGILALRSTQAAAGPVIVAAAVAPLVARNHRATFLSLGSLAGRGANGIALAWLGTLDEFESVLTQSFAIGLVCVALLMAAGLVLPTRSTETFSPS